MTQQRAAPDAEKLGFSVSPDCWLPVSPSVEAVEKVTKQIFG